jgi:hypothetical protein
MIFTELVCTDQFEQGHAGAITPSDSSGKPNGKQGQKVSIQLIHLQRMDRVMKLSQIWTESLFN